MTQRLRTRHTRTGAVIAGLLSFLMATPYAYPEAYIGGQIGTTLSSGLTSVEPTTQFLPGTTHSDLNLDNSFMFGLKGGYFFKGARWFGLEAEFFSTSPHIKHQVHSFSNSNLPGFVASGTLQGAHFRVNTFAPLNLMFRYHKTRLQPYIGIGPGIFFARVSGEGSGPGMPASTSDNGRLGLNAKAGFEYYFTRHLTGFAEWKYNHASFKFKENVELFPFPYGFNATYNMHMVSFGLALHF